jgi:hypothetical protein
MSKKFNLDDYKGKFVMHCKTEEEAKDFCRVLHEAGRKWSSGDSYLEETYWGRYVVDRNGRYYQFNDGMYSTREHFVSNYAILEWSDFMDKEFTKDDLKNGDVVLRRDGDVEIHIMGRFVDEDGRAVGSIFLNRDLSHTDTYDRDIIAVRRPVDISDMSFDAFEKKLGRLVYERDETVEMTIEEVCKALGKNVKIVKEAKS